MTMAKEDAALSLASTRLMPRVPKISWPPDCPSLCQAASAGPAHREFGLKGRWSSASSMPTPGIVVGSGGWPPS